MRSVLVGAPAKVNWTLEVLGRREEGYHEMRSVLTTIGLTDTLTLRTAPDLSLSVYGAPRSFQRRPAETNLAYRAARLLAERTVFRGGASIRLTKRIPIAAGLGGGSSDAAAALRGLRELWELSVSDEELMAIAAELGADVPFFVSGGAAVASGRGERLDPLPPQPPRGVVIAWPTRPPGADKTARMYAALRPEHYTDGSRTERLAARMRDGEPIRDEDVHNVFKAVLSDVHREAADLLQRAAALGLGRPHLCGSGPAFFFLPTPGHSAEPLLDALRDLGLRAMETRALPAAEAVAWDEKT